MKVIILEQAYEDINEIFEYISRDSIKYAAKTIYDIRARINLLKTGKYTGRKVHELNDENIREIIYKSYRIIFETTENTIYIRTIWHCARNFYNIKYKF